MEWRIPSFRWEETKRGWGGSRKGKRERDPNHTSSSDGRQQTWGETSSPAKSSFIRSVSSTLLDNYCSSPYSHPIRTPPVNPISQPPLPPSLSYPSTEKMIFSSYLLHFKPTQPFPSTNLSLSTELSKQRLHQSYMILSQLPYVLNHSAMHFCLLK